MEKDLGCPGVHLIAKRCSSFTGTFLNRIFAVTTRCETKLDSDQKQNYKLDSDQEF